MITRISRESAQGRLSDAPQEKVFWVCDGRVLKNLKDLEIALSDMSDDTFLYHSNEQKKDFSHWVGEVIGDEKLAKDLRKASIRQEAARAVTARVEFLASKVR